MRTKHALGSSPGLRLTARVQGRRHLRTTSVAAAALTMLLIGYSPPAPAQASDPVAFASTSGICDPQSVTSYDLGPQGSVHQNVLVRISTSGTTGGYWLWPDPSWWEARSAGDFGASDTQWSPGVPFSPGDDPTARVFCDTPGSFNYVVSAFDVPATPTSFSGATTALSWSNDGGSTVEFAAPGTAQYVADANVQQGAVHIGDTSVASRATINLGTLGPGMHTLHLDALDGPQAIWTVGIRALPAVLTGPRFGVTAAQPGATLTAPYSVTGDGHILAAILAPNSTPVRTVAAGLAVAAGSHSLTWDGLDANGNPVRDGVYTMSFTFTDSAGNVQTSNPHVVIDSTPPSVHLVSARRISYRQGLAVDVSDRGTRVAAAALSIGGRVVKRLWGSGRIIYRPRSGWWRGQHYEFAVVARDGVGNTRRFSGGFTVKP